MMHGKPICTPSVVLSILVALHLVAAGQEKPWERYTIDNSNRGADGVRLADANGDGRLDIVTGWEESGIARAYFHPGKAACTKLWPGVTVGQAPSVEDAVWVDMTGDGRLDVLSSCEGKEQSLRLHVAPSDGSLLLEENAWRTSVLPVGKQATCWMYALPLNLDSMKLPLHSVQVVVGSKAPAGRVGMLRTTLAGGQDGWSLQHLADAQWIMSLQSLDVDRDGDQDIVYSDRKGKQSGVYWLENTGHNGPWRQHLIGALGKEVMFLQLVPSGSSDHPKYEIVAAVKPWQVYWLVENENCRSVWSADIIELEPRGRIGDAKSVAIGDLTGDGRAELVFSCENATVSKSGVVYLERNSLSNSWLMHDVSGPEGIKYDRVELVDLDSDQDLDILTCEEREGGQGLGIVWYANPAFP